jgi:hypothetical protein
MVYQLISHTPQMVHTSVTKIVSAKKSPGSRKQRFVKIGNILANLKKYKNIHFFLIFETFKATIASNRQIVT